MTKAFLKPILWVVLVTILSTMPPIGLPKFDLFAPDKVGHALCYGVMAWLCMQAFAKVKNQSKASNTAILQSGIFSAFYGILMEIVQGTFFPNRSFEFDDMIANTFGVVVSIGLYLFLKRK